jgi:hypothetical protein
MTVERDRRTLLKLLIAGGVISHTAAAALQGQDKLSTEILERAVTLFEAGIAPERIREILPAVQRNWDFFQAVRDLEMADDIEPAPIFQAARAGRYETASKRAERARPGGSARAEGAKARESGRPPRAKSEGSERAEEASAH